MPRVTKGGGVGRGLTTGGEGVSAYIPERKREERVDWKANRGESGGAMGLDAP